MYEVLNFFALAQAVGAIIGAGGSVIGELAYLKAMQDQRIDHAERAHLKLISRSLRIGMLILLFGSIGLVYADYVFYATVQPALTEGYWIMMTFALFVIAASWAFTSKRIPFWLGSSMVFVGWWSIVLLTIGHFPEVDYGGAMAFYIVAVAIMAVILSFSRTLSRPL